MNLPTTKPNDRDLAWYVRECEALQCINAALKKQANDEFDAVITRNMELERENAALRTALKRWLKVADDCHQEQQEVGYSEYNITVGLVCDTRALLDAARKEAQP